MFKFMSSKKKQFLIYFILFYLHTYLLLKKFEIIIKLQRIRNQKQKKRK